MIHDILDSVFFGIDYNILPCLHSSGLINLKELQISYNRVTDNGIAQLKGMYH